MKAQGHVKGIVPSIPDDIIKSIRRIIITKFMNSKTAIYIIIAIDSTGIKVTNRVQWMQEKLRIKSI